MGAQAGKHGYGNNETLQPNKVQRSGQERLLRASHSLRRPHSLSISNSVCVCDFIQQSRAHTLELPRVFESLLWSARTSTPIVYLSRHDTPAHRLMLSKSLGKQPPVIEILATAANNENHRSSFKAEHTSFEARIMLSTPT